MIKIKSLLEFSKTAFFRKFECLALFVFILATAQCVWSDQNITMSVAPVKGEIKFKPFLTGFQQVLIDNLQDIYPENIMERESLLKYLKKNPGYTEYKEIYIKDLSNLVNDLKVKFVLLCNFKEANGLIQLKVKVFHDERKMIIANYNVDGSINELYALKNKLIESILNLNLLKTQPGFSAQVYFSQEVKLDLDTFVLFSKGLKYYDQKDYLKAFEYFKEVRQKYPEFKSGKKYYELIHTKMLTEYKESSDLGNLKLSTGDLASANKYFKEALNKNPNDVRALIGLGKVCLKEKKPKEAETYFLKAYNLDKNSAEAQANLGKLYETMGDNNKSINYYEQAKKTDPKNIEVHEHLGDLYKKTDNTNLSANEYMSAASLSANEFSVSNAKKNTDKAQQSAPQDLAPLILKADIEHMTAQPMTSLESLQKAQSLSPNNDKIYHKMGDIYKEKGDYDNAKNMYSKSIEINGSNVDANIGMGELAKIKEDFNEAIPHYQKAIGVDPHNKKANLDLAHIYAETGKLKNSLNYYDELEAIDPDNPVIQKEKGDILLEQKNIKKAMRHYEKAVDLDPDYSEAFKTLGVTQKEMGLKQEAIKSFENAKMIDPDTDISEDATKGMQVINNNILKLINSFPKIESSNKMAIIEIGRHFDKIDTPFFDYIRLYPLFSSKIRKEVHMAAKNRYQAVSPDIIDFFFSTAPHNLISSSDIADNFYMDTLCDDLGVFSVLLYKISNEPSEQKSVYNFKIVAFMYNKGGKRFQNTIRLSYSWEDFKKPIYATIVIIIILCSIWIIKYLIEGNGIIDAEIIREPNSIASFSLTLSKNPKKNLTQTKDRLKNASDDLKFRRKPKREKKYERYMVAKNSIFKKIHTGAYHLFLYGIIQDRLKEKEIGNYQMSKKVKVEKNKTQKIIFDLRSTECHAEFYISDEYDNKVAGAEVSIKGILGSKFTKQDGKVFFYLSKGKYTVIVKYQDKHTVQDIIVTSAKEHIFNIYLA